MDGRRVRKNPLAKLKKQLSAQRLKLDKLQEEFEALRARESAMNALATSLAALLQVTEPLRALTDGGHTLPLGDWEQELIGLRQTHAAQLCAVPAASGGKDSGSAATCSTGDETASRGGGDDAAAAAASCGVAGGGAAANAAGASSQPLAAAPSWARRLAAMVEEQGAEALVVRYKGCTGRELAAIIRQFTLEAAAVLFRLRSNAPDAADAERRLQSMWDDINAVLGVVMIARPESLVELNMLQLDTLGPLTLEWTAERGAFMLQEMQLTKHQFQSLLVLLQLYEARVSQLLPRRSELMRQQEATAEDATEQLQVLAAMAACQAGFVWAVMGSGYALLAELLEPTQAAATLVAAYPFMPTLMSILGALRAEQAAAPARAAAAKAAAVAAAATAAAAPRPPAASRPPARPGGAGQWQGEGIQEEEEEREEEDGQEEEGAEDDSGG
ncbi:hypothetical protein Rsub_13206 [Raphidocelis subcapitata]|uniref:Uncharacterized protein n=1 Tax=Raphidocelis subcapitata TaxID=307507 RepID=A0A2V0PLN8_9CHLO|nr:hypothetical protein Rsub_13206 [Raphidocelis subcapitata]|eukprot:GBG00460.1 hypothetical protein Rsub_13206 [Raphidocelis subcapitata]